MSSIVVEDVITDVKDKGNGWVDFRTGSHGVFSTSRKELIQQVYALAQQGGRLQIHGTVKTVDRDGRSWTNQYLESANPAGGLGLQPALGGNGGLGLGGLGQQPAGQPTLPSLAPQLQQLPQAPPQQQPTPDYMRKRDPEEALQIVRQSCMKAAVDTLPYLPESERTPASQVRIAEFWVAYVYGGPRAVGVAPMGGPTGPMPETTDPGPEPQQHYSDADIPF